MYALVNYGPIQAGKQYKIIRSGFDWYCCVISGKVLFVPNFVFDSQGY